jgi:hypothetical protein
LAEDGVEPLYRSEGYHLGSRETGAGNQGFESIGNYIDVGQCKRARHFAEEGGLLVIRFDQGQVDMGSPELQGNRGKPGAGADVEDARSAFASTKYPVASRTMNASGRFLFDRLKVRMKGI